MDRSRDEYVESQVQQNPMYPIRDAGTEQIERALIEIARSGDQAEIKKHWVLYYLMFGVVVTL